MLDANEGRAVGGFLTGLLAGAITRFRAQGYLKIDVLDAGQAGSDTWEIDLETEAGHRFTVQVQRRESGLEEKGTRTAGGVTGTLYGPGDAPSLFRYEEPGWREVTPNELENPEVH